MATAEPAAKRSARTMGNERRVISLPPEMLSN
jgi:hypothetical protein